MIVEVLRKTCLPILHVHHMAVIISMFVAIRSFFRRLAFRVHRVYTLTIIVTNYWPTFVIYEKKKGLTCNRFLIVDVRKLYVFFAVTKTSISPTDHRQRQ